MSEAQNHILDKAQFEELFRNHFSYLCNFARQYVGDADAAQDICQKVFIRLWERRADMDVTKSIKSYLFTAVKNRSLNYIRDHKKYRSRLLDVDCGEVEVGMEDDDWLAAEELQSRINTILAGLPPKCRRVFEMSRFEDKKYREIAAELDISQKTVEAHMSKAMKVFRQSLAPYLTLIVFLFYVFTTCITKGVSLLSCTMDVSNFVL